MVITSSERAEGCLKETIQPLRQTPQLGAAIIGRGPIVCDILKNVHVCLRVCEPHLLFHGESLDVSGQFISGSDEQWDGDGLSVIWLTEQ